MHAQKLITIFLFLIVLAGCGKPVPAEKAAFVGEWENEIMYLLITQNGTVKYERTEGNGSKSVEGPLKGFKGDDFEVGIGPMSTVFVVSKAPYLDGDSWKMVVDGVELTKVSP